MSALLAACGHTDGPHPDTTAPAVTKTAPENGAVMTPGDRIQITFNEKIIADTVVLGGNMAAESDGGTFSGSAKEARGAGTRSEADDETLTIRPQTTWSYGNNRILTVDAKDAAGNSLSTLTLSYDIVAGFVYVSTPANGGDDASEGTKDHPKATIPAAIAQARNLGYGPGLPGAVLVAQGKYTVNSGALPPTHVILSQAISLYGGYFPDFSQRDRENFQTIIEDESTTVSTLYNPSRAVGAGSAITAATIVDGFMINGSGSVEYASGIFNYDGASPTVQNNRIHAGSGNALTVGIMNYNDASPVIRGNRIIDGSAVTLSVGIANILAFPVIEGNTIDGGTAAGQSIGIVTQNGSSAEIKNNVIFAGNAQISIGIMTDSGASAYIRNNIIRGGSGSVSIGIRSDSVSPVIRNNTIHGGSGAVSSWGIATYNSGSVSTAPTIENNLVFTSGSAPDRSCIVEANMNTRPSSLISNDLFDCPTALYKDNSGGNLRSVQAVNALTDTTAGGNVSIDPVFADLDGPDDNINTMADNDWHLTPTSPTGVTQGGMDLSTDFTDDKDGVTRTVPWSMGAYERD
jgi:Bacterial Ig-like domain